MPDVLTAVLRATVHAAATTAIGLLGLTAACVCAVLVVGGASALVGRCGRRPTAAVVPLRIVDPARRSRSSHPAGGGTRSTRTVR